MIDIGKLLLFRYTNARDISRGWNNILVTKTRKNQKIEEEQLVYLAKSPDYCTRDDSLGSFGTSGR